MKEPQTAIPMNLSTVDVPAGVAPETKHVSTPNQEVASSSARLLEALKWAVSFPAMLGMFLIGRIFYEARNFVVDPDVWWHIKVGQDILRSHHWPTTDPYSFTVLGSPWIAYEWLGDVAIGFVAKFGLQALDALLILLGGAIATGLYYYASLCAKNSKAGFASATIVSIFAMENFNLRPQMFGFLFLVITLLVLEHFRQGRPKALWILPPLFLIWINAHGSWIIGLGVILLTLVAGLFNFDVGSVEGVRWTEKQRIQLELALLGSLAMIPLTPYGTQLATYPFMVASSLPLNAENVIEWLPMPFDALLGKLFLAVVVGSFVLQTLYHFKFRLVQWVLCIGGAVMACLHVRFVLLFAPFFCPILAIMLARWLEQYHRDKDKFVLNAVLMAGVAFAMVRYFPTQSQLEHAVETQSPVRAVNFLHSHPVEGPLFNNYRYGGYLIDNLPEHKVFIDGRGDLYEFGGVMGDYVQVVNVRPAAFSVLKFYGIRTVLLQQNEPLAVFLAEHPDWKRIYKDDISVIFVRGDRASTFAGDQGSHKTPSTRSAHEPPAD
jgi:hypothetical protein